MCHMSNVMGQMSCVKCGVSGVTCHITIIFLLFLCTKVVVIGVSFINGATPFWSRPVLGMLFKSKTNGFLVYLQIHLGWVSCGWWSLGPLHHKHQQTPSGTIMVLRQTIDLARRLFKSRIFFFFSFFRSLNILIFSSYWIVGSVSWLIKN